MILPILGCARSLALLHAEEMFPPKRYSCAKQAAPKKSPQNKKKKKDNNAVPFLSHRKKGKGKQIKRIKMYAVW